MLTDIESTRHSADPMLGIPLSLAGRPILFATDGSPVSLTAASVARDLASRHLARVHVVTAMDTRSAPMPPPLDLAVALADATIGDEVRSEQIAELRRGLNASLGETVSWDIRMVLGTPAQAILHEATRLHAALIILGLRRHARMDRVLHDETTLEVIRHAECPVLGIAEGKKGLPVKSLVAMDFSPGSFEALSAARAVLADGATIVLAYAPPMTLDAPEDGEAVIHRLGTDAAFAQCRAELAKDGIASESMVLHRAEPAPIAELLLEYADDARCDLIAVGSVRRGRIDRLLMGSVSTELVRDGRHSVLVVPPHKHRAARGLG
jgi:nucleotide-binding universal stress UspA family protein